MKKKNESNSVKNTDKTLNISDISESLKQQIIKDLLTDLKLKVGVNSSIESHEKHITVEVTLLYKDTEISTSMGKCSTYHMNCR